MDKVTKMLIERFEKQINENKKSIEDRGIQTIHDRNCGIRQAISIVDQFAAEYRGYSLCKTRQFCDYQFLRDDGWISCEKELPPQPKENPVFDNRLVELYLVSDGVSVYPFRAFWNGTIFTDGYGKVDVLEWQPLPKSNQQEHLTDEKIDK